MAEETNKVTVGCTHTNGLMIFLFQHDYDDGTGSGEKMAWRKGPGIRLNGPSGRLDGTNGMGIAPPGFTEIDADWWAKWVEQNKGHNPFFDTGVIFEHKANPTS